MAGPTHSLDSTINQVRNLLDDQYKWDGDGFTIWKELIQNANDTEKVDESHGVSQFHIGWCRGFEGAGHPLLTTPAMFVVNDGRFTHKDARSITCFGDNDKRDKDWQIGRFGLGMKSVFHLCEAFFFLASDIPGDQVPKESHPKRDDIFSPWIPSAGSGDIAPHPLWDSFKSADQQLIRDRLVPIHRDMQEWFCVWIPLRHKTHLEDSGEALTADNPLYFETDDRIRSLFPLSHATRIAELLPLLDQIKSVCIWEPSSLDSIKMTHAVKFADGSSSRKPLPRDGWHAQLPPLEESNFSGTIECNGPAAGHGRSHPYFGIERFIWDGRFRDLREKLPPDRRGRDRKVKAIPHAAVRFLATDSKQGESPRLTVNWAVFIPLSDAENKPVTLPEGMPSVSLHLHGYFFVDAGRNRLKHEASATADGKQTEKVRSEWNDFIEDEGTLLLIIPALDQFVRKMEWSDSQIQELTEALRNTSVWKKRNAQICRYDQWGFIVESDAASGDLIGQWRKFDANCQVLTLPRATSGLPLKVFPKLFDTLADTGEAFRLTFEGEPRLVAPVDGEAKRNKFWPADLAASLVKSVDLESLIANADQCRYLLLFLNECCGELRDSLANWMGKRLREFFAKVGLETVQERADLIQRLVAFVPSEERVCASWAESQQAGAQEVFAATASLNWQVVVVPKLCEHDDDPSTGRLQAGDCESILNWLGNWERKSILETKDFAKFVAWVFELVLPESCDRILASKAALVKATEYARHTQRECWLSPHEIRQAKKVRGNVFAGTNGDSFSKLSEAFVDFPILNLVPVLANAVFGEKEFPTTGDAVRIVNDCGAPLSGPEQRLPLLERLMNSLRSIDRFSEAAKAIRYLLHGHQPHRADMQAGLFMPADDHGNDVWQQLARWTLGKTESHWRLLSPEVSKWADRNLNRGEQETLAIAPLGHARITVLLSSIADFVDFPSDIIDESAYGELLDKVSDLELLKRLPIHQRVADGTRVAITAKTSYWASGFKLDDELANKIELLKAEGGDGRRERRELLTKSLSRLTAIEIALLEPNPFQHWRTILNAFSRLKKIDLPNDLFSAIRSGNHQFSQPWVPTRFGPRWPAQIVNLPGLDVELCRLRDAIQGTIVFHSDIDEPIRTHSAFAKLSELELLPNHLESLDLLKPWMAASINCRTGINSREAFSVWIDLPWPEAVMPAYAVLQSVRKLCDEEDCYQHLAEALFGPIEPVEKCIQAIGFLGKEHARQQDRQTQERLIEKCFLPAVVNAIQLGGWRKTLSRIELLSASGNWKSPSQLTPPNRKIANDDQVDKDVWRCLEPHYPELQSAEPTNIPTAQGTQARTRDEHLQQADEVLDSYFRGWDETVRAPTIGGFLALLGDDQRMRDLAQNYLGRHSIDFVRDNVLRSILPGTRLRPRNLRVEVVIERGATAPMQNLLGDTFQATLGNAAAATSLLVCQKTSRHQEIRVETVHLRPIAPFAANLRECLLNATTEFVAKTYGANPGPLRDTVTQVFKVLSDSEQWDVALAQQTFEDHAEFLLSQLNLGKDPLVRPILTDFNRLRLMNREDKQSQAFGNQPDNQKWLKLHLDTFARLRNVFLLPQNADAQDRILVAVRRIIEGHNGYKPSSVPFEIFQNADDAAVDRVADFSDRMMPKFSFDVFDDAKCLVFRHFGRCVNQVPSTNTGRIAQQVMADDLSGMLTLWMSTKGVVDEAKADEPHHTGKFGLGFKSVFLISKCPMLLSGDLACRIVGGVYPIHLPVTERHGLFGNYLPDETLRPLTTVLRLPLDVGPKSDEVLDGFQKLAHLQVIFGRQIHRINFSGQTNPRTVSWEPKTLAVGCWHGELASREGAANAPKTRAIVLQAFGSPESKDRIGELLLQYDGKRFCPLHDDVPTIWTTAPIQEALLKLGFAINGDFELDTGRANLASACEKNQELVLQLGKGFFLRLSDLFKRSETGWTEFCRELNLSDKSNCYDFWLSLWEMFTEKFLDDDSHNADQLVRHMLWDKDSGTATLLYRQHAALPNGLLGQFQKLITATDVRFAAKGVLLNAKVLGAVESWPSMQKNVSRSDVRNVVVAKDTVAARLAVLAPKLTAKPINDLTLAKLLEWEAEISPCLDEVRVKRLAELLFNDPLTVRIQGKDQHPQEWSAIEPMLGRFRFLDADNHEQPASQLLIAVDSEKAADGDGSEEAMIAAFAPPDRVLSSAYQDDSLRLFKICRAPRKTVTAREVADWAANARGAQQKDAVIHYLSRGRLRESVIEVLKSQGFCWITPFLSSFKDADSQEREAKQAHRSYERSEAIRTDPATALRKIFEWWIKERPQRQHQFKGLSLTDSERGVFRHDYDPHNLEHRKAWLRVFILAMSHTKGRKQTWHTRTFLEVCEQRRWLDTFANSESESVDWLGILDGYLDQTWEDAQYYDWLGLFPGIYAIAQRLDLYAFAFQNITKRKEEFSLREITRPQHPIPAPSINRVLGMGTNFIIREMLRSGAFETPAESPACAHAFVPTTRFQKTLKVLRCELPGDRDHQSIQAYRYFKRHLGLEAATFGGDFDIPFQVLAGRENEQLQNELLDALIPQDDDSEE